MRCGGPAQVSEQIVTRPRERILTCPPSLPAHIGILAIGILGIGILSIGIRTSVDFFLRLFVFVGRERMSILTHHMITVAWSSY